MKRTWPCIVIALLMGLMVPTAWAEEQSGAAVYNLGEMVVTGDKPGVKDMAITNDITAEEIKATNAKTVAEALQYVPGIVVTTGVKNQPSISMHGFDQTKILFMIDGIPYYETKYGKLDLNKIPASVVSKIEVIKGAASVLYGANAEAGVINIITKQGTEKPWAEANVAFGEHDTHIAEVSHGAQFGAINYWLSFSRQHTLGWRMSDDYDVHEGEFYLGKKYDHDEIFEDGGFRDNSGYTTNALWTRIGLVPNDDAQYFATFHYIDSDHGMPANVDEVAYKKGFSEGYGTDKDDIDWGIDLSGQQKLNDIATLRGKLFYHNHEDKYVSYTDTTYKEEGDTSHYKDYIVGGSLFTDLDLFDWYTARFAGHYRGDSHKQRSSEEDPYESFFSYTGSVAMENEFRPIEGLTAILGASYDWFDVTKAEEENDGTVDEIDTPDIMDEFNPMVGLTYEFKDTTKVFGSVAKKTRFPTLNQLYKTETGNPDLTAEKTINYSIGVSRTFFDIIDTNLSYFYSDVTDYITRNSNTVGYNNEGNVILQGFEIGATVYPMENLTISAGYTYTDAEDKSDDAYSDEVVDVPVHKIDVGIDYMIPVVLTKLHLQGIYIGQSYYQVPTADEPDIDEEKLNDYFILNGRLSKQFLEYFEGYVEVNNIFDKDYYSEESFPGRGRSFMVGISAKI
jgi:iron complex outermembrane receptor protein